MKPVSARWRPLVSADAEQLQGAVDDALAAWQRLWFEQPATFTIEAQPLPASTAISLTSDTQQWTLDRDLHLVSRGTDWNHYAEKAMDYPEEAAGMPAHPLQLQMRDSLRDELLDELIQSIGAGLAPSRTLEKTVGTPFAEIVRFRHGGLKLVVASRTCPRLLELYCSAELLWNRTRIEATAIPPSPALASRTAALAATGASISANLGQCRVTAMELSSLAIGDVLTTSQALTQPVELRLDPGNHGPVRILARGHPVRSGDRIAVALTSINKQ